MKRAIPSLIIVSALAGGCVQRKMTITSEPSEALVYMNGKEIGRTPIETDFTHYGKYDVQVRKPGYDTLKTVTPVEAPWWQYVPLDLLAELMPWHPTDHQKLHYTLQQSKVVDTPAEIMIDSATELKGKLEGSQVKSVNQK